LWLELFINGGNLYLLTQEIYHQNGKNAPQLNHINYIWVTNLINDSSKEMNPTVEELLEWVKTGQVEAKRK